MFFVTKDHKHYLKIKDEKEAIRLANNIDGVVYTAGKQGMDLVYNSQEECSLELSSVC